MSQPDAIDAATQRAAAPPAQPTVPQPSPEATSPAPGDLPRVYPETEVAATFEAMRRKRRRTDKVKIPTTDDAGNEVTLVVTLQSISSPAYDELLDKNPPSKEGRGRGELYNASTFIPSLIAACSLAPKLSYDQVRELIDSEEWSAGEMGSIFGAAWRLCQAGVDVPFIGSA